MGLCPKPSVTYPSLTLFTFPRVPYYVPHVLPWFPKRFSGIPYVPIRSVQPLPQIQKKDVLKSYVPIRSVPTVPQKRKNAIQIVRSYTFWATLPINPTTGPYPF